MTIAVAQLQPEFDPNSDYRFKYTSFGEVLLGADVDGDGFADLVVGAPHADPDASTLQVKRAPSNAAARVRSPHAANTVARPSTHPLLL